MEKLLLVDFPLIVSGMTFLLQEYDMKDIKVQGVATLEEMEAQLKKEKFCLLIIGIQIRTGRQAVLLMEMMKKYKGTPVMIFNDSELLLPERKLYQAGLRGILSKEAKKEEIILAIRQIKSGGIYISQTTFYKFLMMDTRNLNPFDNLTLREREVADMLIEGKKNRQIGEALTLMPSTISTFKTKIFKKLHVNSLVELERVGKELKNMNG